MRAGITVKAIACLLTFALFIILALAAYGDRFITNSEADFNEGTYENTTYTAGDTAVMLNNTHTAGRYASKIFDAGTNHTRWDTISKNADDLEQNTFLIIDGQKKAFLSAGGTNWTMTTNDYGGTANLDGLVITTANRYLLLDNKDIYHSTDQGATWTKINDQFTPYSQDGLKMAIDSNDAIYIIDASQRVFKSTDSGYNWTELNSDFNGATTNDIKGLAITSQNTLFAVDGSGAVYSSANQGLNWTYLADYGGNSDTDAITSDHNDYLYILWNKKIYQSTNAGINWTNINNEFTPYSQNGMLLFTSKTGELIIADSNGRIFESSNQGINWTELGDCNNQSSHNPKTGTAGSYKTNITVLTRSCSDTACTLETFSVLQDNLTAPNNRYFQYAIEFRTNQAPHSSKLHNITIEYSLIPDTTNPAVPGIRPLINSTFNISTTIEISANISDDRGISQAFANITYPDSTAQLLQLNPHEFLKYNASFIAPNTTGTYSITFIANDTSGNINNTETTYFTVPAKITNENITNNTNTTNTTNTTLPDTTPPAVLNITPLAGTNFSLNSIVDITVNATDDTAIDTIFANITQPDLTTVWIQLFDDNNDSVYNNSIAANQPGWYYVTIIANDTSGNTNNTEKTHFDPTALGGGSGGGGGGTARQAYQSQPDWRKMPDAQIIRPLECVESWLCMPWSECNPQGYKTRTCEDYYKCGTNKTMPLTQLKCTELNKNVETMPEKEKEKPPEETRFAVSLLLPPEETATTISSAGLISIIILIGISAYLLLRKKKRKGCGRKKKAGILRWLKKCRARRKRIRIIKARTAEMPDTENHFMQ